jgi:hypothetical protein
MGWPPSRGLNGPTIKGFTEQITLRKLPESAHCSKPVSLRICRFGVVAAWEVSMDLRETSNPECKTQMDTIGWLFVAVFVVITTVAGVVAYNANDLTVTKAPVAVAAR